MVWTWEFLRLAVRVFVCAARVIEMQEVLLRVLLWQAPRSRVPLWEQVRSQQAPLLQLELALPLARLHTK